jgi:hypothetical protein
LPNPKGRLNQAWQYAYLRFELSRIFIFLSMKKMASLDIYIRIVFLQEYVLQSWRGETITSGGYKIEHGHKNQLIFL